MNLQKYHTANLPELMKIISKNGIGMDDYLDRFFNSYETTTNYPPYNLIHVNNVESVLEIALAGFSKKELKVYTEYGKLIVEGEKESKRDIIRVCPSRRKPKIFLSLDFIRRC